MKIQIASDLHAEFDPRGEEPNSWKSLKNAGADILVLAGDICQLNAKPGLDAVFAALQGKWNRIVFVCGNHEAHGSSITEALQTASEIAESFPGITVLDNEFEEIDGVLFYGGTGWYPDPESDPVAWSAREYMADHRLIQNLYRDAARSHAEFTDNLFAGDWGPAVVVSHHLPSWECVAPKYAGSALNHFFVSGFPVEQIGARLWIHGHSHSPVDLMMGKTRVIANPKGYPGEFGPVNLNFNPELVVEVEPRK